MISNSSHTSSVARQETEHTRKLSLKNNIVSLTYLPYSRDLSPEVSSLFFTMEMQLKGRRFNTIVEIQIESQMVLDSLTEKEFDAGFQM